MENPPTPPDNHTDPLKQPTLKERLKYQYGRQPKPLRILLGVLAGMLILGVVGGSLLFATLTRGLPDVTKLDQYDPASTTKIFSSDGTLIATLFDENRTFTKYKDIAPIMVTSIVAIEDRRFFEHGGVDWKGIARAAIGNAAASGVEQGASTLTMQLARRLFLSDERTYTRKLREAVLAHRIDSTLSKEKVLELYLNEVYFGAGAYGVDAAAAVYFAKNPDQLELWQAALLAGLVQAPSATSPLVDRDASLKRLEEVLAALVAENKITEPQSIKARKAAGGYRFVDRPTPTGEGMLKYPYFTTYAIRELSKQFPENYIRRGGLQVVTTLDIGLQETAEASLKEELQGPGLAVGADAGAVVTIDNNTGDLLAMVGGADWNTKNQFNRAWQAKRQPGSAFKMFVYAAALEAGFNPEQEFADTEATFMPDSPSAWSPDNSDRQFMGAIPMRTGLQFSRNLVAAKVIAHVGPERVITLAHRLGIDSELPPVVSLALGAGEVTPLQMGRAFSVLPTGGILRPTRVLKKVTDSRGKVLKDFSAEPEEDRVLGRDTAKLMCEMLHRVVVAGTGTSANLSETFVAGKTGTTDSFVDAWFVGFTPHHTIAVWIGRDDNKPMGRVYGGTIPADVFRTVAKAGLKKHPATASLPGVKFDDPQKVKLCWDSTYVALPQCPKTYSDVFQAGVVPTRPCPIHRTIKIPQTVVMKVATTGGVTDPSLGGSGSTTVTTTGGTTTTTGGVISTTTGGGAGTVTAVKISSEDIPDDLNPRKDPEVMTSRGAVIFYTEKEPDLKGVDIVIEGSRRVPMASPTPGEDPMNLTDLQATPGLEGSPSLTIQGGTGVSTEQPDDPAGANDIPTAVPTLGGDQPYPKAGQTQSTTGASEVIYESDESVPSAIEKDIPPDPTAR